MNKRLQGTDGIRGETRLSTDPSMAGMTPQEVFLSKNILTEQFFELYIYARVRQLFNSGMAKQGDRMTIGWDPRDETGLFRESAVRGALKGGIDVDTIGVIPTPAIPVYMNTTGCAVGAMITASHNPAFHNGIKIFTRCGLKPLPGDDFALSAIVCKTDWSDLEKIAPSGKRYDRHEEAFDIFERFSLDPKNSWIDDPSIIQNVTLVLDTANGAMREIAPAVMNKVGFKEVVTCNASDKGSHINVKSGVADLEGAHIIEHQMVEHGGRFAGYSALETLFNIAKKRADKFVNGEETLTGAVFDGDGDRFYRLDYNPLNDTCSILSGDEISAHTAIHKGTANRLFVNTVESDLGVTGRIKETGMNTEITAVGDKWILLTAFLSQVKKIAPPEIWDRIERIVNSTSPSADVIEKIIDEANLDPATVCDPAFLIGAEESGHSVTCGFLGNKVVFAGNGLKACLNTFSAIEGGKPGLIKSVEERIEAITNPYPAGFKKTMYVYYIDKNLWSENSQAWTEVKKRAKSAIKNLFPDVTVEIVTRPEEKEMLYLKIIDGGLHTASIFVRPSGTEDKIGVTLRGSAEDSEKLLTAGMTIQKILLTFMKDKKKPFAVAELKLLEQANSGGAPKIAVSGMNQPDYERLLIESGTKQGLLTSASPGAFLTEYGKWYLSTIRKETQ